MSILSKIRGTFETLFQLGKGGPQLKNNAGVIEHRNSADTAYVVTRGADPSIADDLVTKRYGDANYAGASSAVALSQHVVASNFTVTAAKAAHITRYVEVSAGITLEIGADGDLEIG